MANEQIQNPPRGHEIRIAKRGDFFFNPRKGEQAWPKVKTCLALSKEA
jgi:hypothetical protein